MNNLLPISGQSGYNIAFLKPQSFEDAQYAIEQLKQGTVVLFNLAALDPKLAQRISDYAAGSTCAIAGEAREVGNGVFIYTPPSVLIKTQL
ncbi:cell division protein SepF [Synechococcales cyanobacterium C]|uniref:Cell division protein SepF n=1 Tax=Petrachloros mirabilis ULC683 TaxID=2781853 RepID=A0A8K2A777_9CYAN|nr:cell division protein SepF [Petrachloros mirabilis]NCJ05889.1 cell division protein SepF [Petrachloros mirabilis ULC683]